MLGGSSGRVEFGADSAILVRSDDARDKLRKHIGDGELSLTV